MVAITFTETAFAWAGLCRYGACGFLGSSGTFHALFTYKEAAATIEYSYLETGSSYNAIACYSKLNADFNYIESGKNAFFVKSAKLELRGNEANSSNVTDYGFFIDMHGEVGLDVASTVTGTTGDIYWHQTNTSASHPTAGNSITDNQGSRLTVRR
jgi:hypothetical protein